MNLIFLMRMDYLQEAIERARQKRRQKHGGGRQRQDWDEIGPFSDERADEILSSIEQRVTDFLNGVRPVRAEAADV